MGILLGSEMIEEVKANLGRLNLRSDSISDQRYYRVLNLIQRRIVRVYGFSELSVLDSDDVVVSGNPETDRSYTFSLSGSIRLRQIKSMRLEQGGETYNVRGLNSVQFDQLVPMDSSVITGRPVIYTRKRNALQLWPVPDQDYTWHRRYTIWPSDITAGGTSILEDKDDVIIAVTTAYFARQLGDVQTAHEYQAEALDLVKEAVQHDSEEADDLATLALGLRVDRDIAVDYWRDPFTKRNP